MTGERTTWLFLKLSPKVETSDETKQCVNGVHNWHGPNVAQVDK